MVAVPVLPASSSASRLAVVAKNVLRSPVLSLWRRDPLTTRLEWRRNGKLYCVRWHPHRDAFGRDCSERFMLVRDQVAVLLAHWSDTPLHIVWLPQPGKTRCRAQRLPDGGVQFTRLDQRGAVGGSFRLFARDVTAFLAFAQRGLRRRSAETPSW